MNVIVWAKQGGRRYTQWGAPSVSTVGVLWTTIGQSGGVAAAAAMILGYSARRRRRLS